MNTATGKEYYIEVENEDARKLIEDILRDEAFPSREDVARLTNSETNEAEGLYHPSGS